MFSNCPEGLSITCRSPVSNEPPEAMMLRPLSTFASAAGNYAECGIASIGLNRYAVCSKKSFQTEIAYIVVLVDFLLAH
jgi:hypothetical protein